MDLTPFSFNGKTFVVEINDKEYAREDSRSLYSLLTHQEPEVGGVVTKAGAMQSSTYKDQPVDFYRAQLLHYGCRDRKTKEAAKKELLKAFGDNNKRLPIPPDLIEYEKELKDRHKLEKKVAAGAKKVASRNEVQSDGMGKKRKVNEGYIAELHQAGSSSKPALSRNQLLKEIVELPEDKLREFLQKTFDDNAGLEGRCVGYLAQIAQKPTSNKRAKKPSSSKTPAQGRADMPPHYDEAMDVDVGFYGAY